MKILIVTQYWHPQNGVPQRRWSWLTKLLISHGYEVEVFVPEDPSTSKKLSEAQRNKVSFWQMFTSGIEPEKGPSGENIFRVPGLSTGNSIIQRGIAQCLNAIAILYSVNQTYRSRWSEPPVLVIGTVPAIPTSILTPLVSRLLSVSYVIDLRDAWPELLTESRKWNSSLGSRSALEKFLYGWPFKGISAIVNLLMGRSLQNAAGILVTSETHRDYLRKKLNQGPEPRRKKIIEVVRNVYPEIGIGKAAEQMKVVESKGALNILYAGTVGRAQNLRNAVEAVRLGRHKGLDLRLRIVGDGAAWDSLSASTAKEEYIELLHKVPVSELERQFEWADTCLVHLTDWKPLALSVPSKIFELMSNQMHISAVLGGEGADLVKLLDAGFVVSPEEPYALAEEWAKLSHNRLLLDVSDSGRNWVISERTKETPEVLFDFFDRILSSTDLER